MYFRAVNNNMNCLFHMHKATQGFKSLNNCPLILLEILKTGFKKKVLFYIIGCKTCSHIYFTITVSGIKDYAQTFYISKKCKFFAVELNKIQTVLIVGKKRKKHIQKLFFYCLLQVDFNLLGIFYLFVLFLLFLTPISILVG